MSHFPVLLRRPWLWLLIALVTGAIACAIYEKIMDDRLVRRDPDTIAADRGLYAYGRKAGERLFRENCVGCHGDHGQGDTGLGIANLTDHDWIYGEGNVGEIEHTIRYGIRAPDPRTQKLAAMPAFATASPYAAYKIEPLTPGEIADVVAFLRGLRHEKTDADAARRGAALYQNKGQCFDCHGADAKGDNFVGTPNLTDKVWLYGDGSARSEYLSIAQGRAGMCPAWVTKLSSVELREVALYVHTLSEQVSK